MRSTVTFGEIVHELDQHLHAGQRNRIVDRSAHAAGLAVHAYTFRVDRLPAFADSPEAALNLLVRGAGIDGLFSDFPDVCVNWRARHAASDPPAR